MKKGIYNGIRYVIYRAKSIGYGKSKASKYLMVLIRFPKPSLSSLNYSIRYIRYIRYTCKIKVFELDCR